MTVLAKGVGGGSGVQITGVAMVRRLHVHMCNPTSLAFPAAHRSTCGERWKKVKKVKTAEMGVEWAPKSHSDSHLHIRLIT